MATRYELGGREMDRFMWRSKRRVKLQREVPRGTTRSTITNHYAYTAM